MMQKPKIQKRSQRFNKRKKPRPISDRGCLKEVMVALVV